LLRSARGCFPLVTLDGHEARHGQAQPSASKRARTVSASLKPSQPNAEHKRPGARAACISSAWVRMALPNCVQAVSKRPPEAHHAKPASAAPSGV
jgi:hypothetical protein